MRGFFIVIATICVLAMFLGILNIFGRPFGYDVGNKLFEFFECDETCIWLVVIGGGLLAGFFSWLASKSQNRK